MFFVKLLLNFTFFVYFTLIFLTALPFFLVNSYFLHFFSTSSCILTNCDFLLLKFDKTLNIKIHFDNLLNENENIFCIIN